jgi:hypothetical protein
MEEEKYPVCEHRNVAAAYERFFGPDSGAQFAPFSSHQVSNATNVFTFAVGRIRLLFERLPGVVR